MWIGMLRQKEGGEWRKNYEAVALNYRAELDPGFDWNVTNYRLAQNGINGAEFVPHTRQVRQRCALVNPLNIRDSTLLVSIWFKKICKTEHLTPNYVHVTVNGKNQKNHKHQEYRNK
jgi:hypothetical protein